MKTIVCVCFFFQMRMTLTVKEKLPRKKILSHVIKTPRLISRN